MSLRTATKYYATTFYHYNLVQNNISCLRSTIQRYDTMAHYRPYRECYGLLWPKIKVCWCRNNRPPTSASFLFPLSWSPYSTIHFHLAFSLSLQYFIHLLLYLSLADSPQLLPSHNGWCHKLNEPANRPLPFNYRLIQHFDFVPWLMFACARRHWLRVCRHSFSSSMFLVLAATGRSCWSIHISQHTQFPPHYHFIHHSHNFLFLLSLLASRLPTQEPITPTVSCRHSTSFPSLHSSYFLHDNFFLFMLLTFFLLVTTFHILLNFKPITVYTSSHPFYIPRDYWFSLTTIFVFLYFQFIITTLPTSPSCSLSMFQSRQLPRLFHESLPWSITINYPYHSSPLPAASSPFILHHCLYPFLVCSSIGNLLFC